jgi:ubiquinone/menaquinone biosynthesis C-methylase UbiE
LFEVNLLHFPLWILRRNERDVVNFYNFMTPYIGRATGSNMLNFGYWSEKTKTPLQAQNELCTRVGEFANLDSAKKVIDIGSGFSAPAIHWKAIYTFLNITCINVNLLQLKSATKLVSNTSDSKTETLSNTKEISFVNAAATILPFVDQCVDRVVALESAQHFKSLIQFMRESKRILKHDGLFIVAIPVITTNKPLVHQFMKLGILSLTWASERYKLTNIKSMIKSAGFNIVEIQHIGSHVYEPLSDYYIQNRKIIKYVILKESHSYFHNILYDVLENLFYKSALKMKEVYQKGIIDYVLIKAH